MKNLLEISKLVNKKRVKKIEIFDEYNLSVKNSKFNEFYEALQHGAFNTDKEAAKQLYQCEPTDDRYRQLKSRFRKRLLNTLFFLDVNAPNASNYSRAYFSCQKEWALVKILELNGAYDSAATLARQIFVTAQKFQFADILVDAARLLRKFAAETKKQIAYEEYDKHLKVYKDVLEAEIRSEEFYQRAKIAITERETADLRAHIDTYCDALLSLNATYKSAVITYNVLLMQCIRGVMLAEYAVVIAVAIEAERYMAQHPDFFRQDVLEILECHRMNAHLHLREFRAGKSAFEKIIFSEIEGSEYWFNVHHSYFLLCLHTDNYIPAATILNKVLKHTSFKKIEESSSDFWLIAEAYINFIVEVYGAESISLRRQARRMFKWQTFFAKEIDAKQQPAQFAHTQLLKFLHAIDSKNLELATEVIENFKQSLQKSLKTEISKRFIVFLRLLQQLEKFAYKPNDIINSEKYLFKLSQLPFSYQGNLSELEVLRFETLWKIICQRLK